MAKLGNKATAEKEETNNQRANENCAKHFDTCDDASKVTEWR